MTDALVFKFYPDGSVVGWHGGAAVRVVPQLPPCLSPCTELATCPGRTQPSPSVSWDRLQPSRDPVPGLNGRKGMDGSVVTSLSNWAVNYIQKTVNTYVRSLQAGLLISRV